MTQGISRLLTYSTDPGNPEEAHSTAPGKTLSGQVFRGVSPHSSQLPMKAPKILTIKSSTLLHELSQYFLLICPLSHTSAKPGVCDPA